MSPFHVFQAAFADLEDEIDEDVELEQLIGKPAGKAKSKRKQKQETVKGLHQDTDEDEDSGFGVDQHASDDSDEDDSGDDDSDDDRFDFTKAFHTKKKKGKKATVKKSVVDGIEVVPKSSLDPSLKLDAEGLAIGAAMVQSRKRKREIVDSAYHRCVSHTCAH